MKNAKVKPFRIIKWLKENKNGIGDFLFTWLPTILGIGLCVFCLFPWSDLISSDKKFMDVISEKDSVIAILFISYAVVISKNNFDLSQKVLKEIKHFQKADADNFFIVRDELEPLAKIFEEANTIQFSGGHLYSVIMSQNDALNNFLRSGHRARFILPNPINGYIMGQYAEKLMVNMSKEVFTDSVVLSLKTIMSYQRDSNLDVDVRVYNTIPAFGMQIIEASTGNRIYVELYTMQTELSERLLFPVMQSNSGEMYLRFKKQFEILWSDSQKIEDVKGLQELLNKQQ